MRDEKLNVWIRGSKENPEGVRQALINAGGDETRKLNYDDPDEMFFIDPDGAINHEIYGGWTGSIIRTSFQEIQPVKPEHKFNPFDKVLVRDDENQGWLINFFSSVGYNMAGNFVYHCVKESWRQCIPYEGNEDLLNTNRSPKQ